MFQHSVSFGTVDRCTLANLCAHHGLLAPHGDRPGRQATREEGALSVLSNRGQAKSAVTEPQKLKLDPSLSCFNRLNS